MTLHDAHWHARARAIIQYAMARSAFDGRCRLWTRAMTTDGKPRAQMHQQQLNLRRELYRAKHGRIPAGRDVTPRCGNPRCLSHLQALTRSARIKLQFEQGIYGKTPARIKRIASSRARASVNSMDKAREVRALREQGLTLKRIVQATGVKYEMARRICNGQAWRETAATNASVFTWRPAA